MAKYDGVHIQEYDRGGVPSVRAWWYTGKGSARKHRGLGRRAELNKADIAAARKDIEAELAKTPELITAGDSPTLSVWWSEYQRINQPTAANAKELEATVTLLIKNLGDRELDTYTEKDAATWRAWLATHIRAKVSSGEADRPPAEATICKHIRHASAIFGEELGAARHMPQIKNPFRHERMNVETKKRDHPNLTPEQLRRLIEAAPTTASRCLIALCAYAGLRLSEALRLTWEDVAFGRARLTATTTKNVGAGKGKERVVRMEPELEVILAQAKADKLESPCHGLGDKERRPYAAINKAWDAAGIEAWPDPFHALRRQRESTWGMKHAGWVVAQWLGHSGQVSVRHYLTVPDSAYDIKTRDYSALDNLTDDQWEQVKKFSTRLQIGYR